MLRRDRMPIHRLKAKRAVTVRRRGAPWCDSVGSTLPLLGGIEGLLTEVFHHILTEHGWVPETACPSTDRDQASCNSVTIGSDSKCDSV